MIEPFEWNVVVAGAWNRAILTPAWIERRMFKRDGAVVEVQVPLDGPGPMSVVLDGIVVQVAGAAIVVAPTRQTIEALCKAAEVASNAVESLSETPVSACGINIRYRIEEAQQLGELCRCTIDDAAVRAGFQVHGRQLQRTLGCEEGPLSAGAVNMILTEDEAGKTSVVFNFHRPTRDCAAIREWLGVKPDLLKETVRVLLSECCGIEEGVV